MNIQDVVFSSGALVELRQANEKEILPFCLDGYDLGSQDVVTAEHTKLKERPAPVSTTPSEDRESDAPEKGVSSTAWFITPQPVAMQVILVPRLVNTLPNAVVPAQQAGIPPQIIDASVGMDSHLRGNDVNKYTYLQEEAVVPGSLSPVEKKDMPVTMTGSKEPVKTSTTLGDAMRQFEKTTGLDLYTDISSERLDHVIIMENQILSASRGVESKKMSLDDLTTEGLIPKMAEYDAAINDLVSTINEKIIPSESGNYKNSPTIQSVSRDGSGTIETKSALSLDKYSVGDAGAALKIDAYMAKIKVHPPELGQITAEIILNKGLTELTLTAENRAVTDFIQRNMHELHEKFVDSNINLSQVTIQDSATQNRQSFSQNQTSSAWGDQTEELDLAEHPNQEVTRQSDSMIDTYA